MTSARKENGSLSLWKNGLTRDAIADFIDRVTREGSSDFVEPQDRVAVFDNDGTLPRFAGTGRPGWRAISSRG